MILQELIRSKSRSQDKIITNGKPALHNTIPHSIATSKLFYNIAIFSHLRLKKINPRMAQSIKMAITTPITVPATAVEFDNLTVETYNACMEAQN